MNMLSSSSSLTSQGSLSSMPASLSSSWCSSSSSQSNSSLPNKSSLASYMQGSRCHGVTDGFDHTASSTARRRLIKQHVFRSVDVDWKSIPVTEETTYAQVTLRRRRDLQCNATHEYLVEVLKAYRRPAEISLLPDSHNILIDGEEIVDMIG